MKPNIIYIGSYTIAKDYRTALAKRVVNQVKYLQNKFDILIITFSPINSGLSFNRNFYINNKQKIIFLILLPIYWFVIFLIILIRRIKSKNNYLILGTLVDLNSSIPLIFAKALGYKIVHDIVEDFKVDNDHPSFLQNINHILGIKISSLIRFYVNGIIVISDRLYAKNKILQVPIVKLYNSVEELVNKTSREKSNIFTFFYSGTYGIKDGVLDLIQAFYKIEKYFPNTKLVLVGKGESKYLEKLMQLIKNNPKIEYCGYLTEDEMFDMLSSSDILCVTRINDEYANNGFPFKLAEYLSFGIPVISTSVSDIPSIFTDKENILLAEPENIDSIASAMKFAIDNQDKVIQIGKNGKKLCENLFSIDNIGKIMSDFLDRI
jgi:glycosyltransferase involved in cell wall biosynthesis